MPALARRLTDHARAQRHARLDRVHQRRLAHPGRSREERGVFLEQGAQLIDALACIGAGPDHRVAQATIEPSRFIYIVLVRQIGLIEANQ